MVSSNNKRATTAAAAISRKMKRRKSKFSRKKNTEIGGGAAGWQRVDVQLGSAQADLDSSPLQQNHYDNPREFRAKDDLEASPAEPMGMFLGLEVLDGSLYQVQNNVMTILEEKEKNGGEDQRDYKDDSHHPASSVSSQQPQQPTTAILTDEKQKKKKKKKKRKVDDSRVDHDNTDNGNNPTQAQSTPGDQDDEPQSKSNQKKKKTKKSKSTSSLSPPPDADDNDGIDSPSLSLLQSSWMVATGGVELSLPICRGLFAQGFHYPTPIQAATLPAAILGRRNLVGAAPTGSGKTLAFLLPILEQLLVQRKANDVPLPLLALIIAPTRELALQIAHEAEKLQPKTTGVLVGGLAVHKQRRILDTRKPPILVGTPGRLWELISSHEHPHLNDLSQVRFLVIDEADRMIQQGSFPQLKQILEAVHTANPIGSDSEDEEEEEEEDDDEDPDRLYGLPGIPGEAKVQMLDEILDKMKEQQRDGDAEEEPVTAELMDEEYEEQQLQQQRDAWEDSVSIALPSAPPVPRQTFVFSATLTLPHSDAYVSTKKKQKKRRNSREITVGGALAEILEKARAGGKTKVVDLTTSNKMVVAKDGNRSIEIISRKEESAITSPTAINSTVSSRLPPGLTLRVLECTQRHKDSFLYTYLVTTQQGASGPCLIFCNSIAAVRRVGTTLLTLRLPVRMLHANMPQKARFKAVESLRQKKSRCIVVATDVAARGLDIPSVATVVHYDVARQTDTFVHRAGRTARGVGEDAVGSSLSLVAPNEDKAHEVIASALGSKKLFQTVPLDGRLLREAQERVNLASKIVAADEAESRVKQSNAWFETAAREAGLEVDEDMLEEGLSGGDLREQQQLKQAQQAKAALRVLLARPMVTQRFGKFLSSNSAAAKSKDAPVPYVVPMEAERKLKKRKRKRKSG